MNFKEDFTRYNIFDLVFKEFNPALISFTGSNLLDIKDESSDYDLVVITANTPTKNIEMIYNGKKVHWYYRGNDFLEGNNINKCDQLTKIGGMQLYYFNENHIIYKAKDFDLAYENFKNIAKKYAKSFLLDNTDFINNIINDNSILNHNKTKFLYHLCVATHVIDDTPLDKNMLASLKRIRWSPITKKVQTYCVERFKIWMRIKEKK